MCVCVCVYILARTRAAVMNDPASISSDLDVLNYPHSGNYLRYLFEASRFIVDQVSPTSRETYANTALHYCKDAIERRTVMKES